MRKKITKRRIIFLAILVLGIYFSWQYRGYIYHLFEECQYCNGEKIKDCNNCLNGYIHYDCSDCIEGKMLVNCNNCKEINCNKCDGKSIEPGIWCLSAEGGCDNEGTIKSCDLCKNGKIEGEENCKRCYEKFEPCPSCNTKGTKICDGKCVKGCGNCQGTGKKDCFFCVDGIIHYHEKDILDNKEWKWKEWTESCTKCGNKGYNKCKKCNGKGK